MLPRLLGTAIALMAVTLSSLARADCPPEKFLLQEYTDLLTDDELKYAFLETMNVSEFQRAKQASQSGVNIPVNGVPLGAYENSEQAKEAGRTEARMRGFTLDTSQSKRLIANRVSVTGGSKYLDCLQNENTPLLMRLSRQEDNIYTVTVRFAPRNENFRWKKPNLQGFRLASTVQSRFPPNQNRNLNFRRVSDEAGSIELNIGDETNSILFPPVQHLKRIRTEDKTYTTQQVAAVTSGGVSGPDHRVDAKCETVEPGWVFLPGSEQKVGRQDDETGWDYIRVDANKVCWQVWSDTSAKEVSRTIEARVALTERRVVPEPDAVTSVRAPSQTPARKPVSQQQ